MCWWCHRHVLIMSQACADYVVHMCWLCYNMFWLCHNMCWLCQTTCLIMSQYELTTPNSTTCRTWCWFCQIACADYVAICQIACADYVTISADYVTSMRWLCLLYVLIMSRACVDCVKQHVLIMSFEGRTWPAGMLWDALVTNTPFIIFCAADTVSNRKQNGVSGF